MVECHNLYHVKTLCHSDVQGVLRWLGEYGDFTFGDDEDTVTVLNRLTNLYNLRSVGVMGVYEEPQLQDKDHLIVHIKRDPSESCKYDSIVLFLVIQCSTRVPYSQELSTLIKDAQKMITDPQTLLFPNFANCRPQPGKAIPQETQPVIDGFLPSSYKTTRPRMSQMTIDNFERKYEPLKCTVKAATWSIYTDITTTPGSKCEFDLEELITIPNKMMGRGGFGVTVPITNDLVAKTTLFPEMVNWSVPFIEEEFSRYAHVASQAEEIMIGETPQYLTYTGRLMV